MSLLGPDGKPIRRANEAPGVREFVQQAKTMARQGAPDQALQQMVFAFQRDVKSDLVVNTTCELLEQLAQARGDEQNEELQLFLHLRENRDDPQIYYFIGSRFLQLGQYVISRPFLAQARQMLEGEQNELSQTVDVEYSQALMELGAYQQAVDILQNFNDTYGGLPVELILKMVECFALMRQLDNASALYGIINEEALRANKNLEDWHEEVGDMLARVQDFESQEEMGLREWHYVQTRGMLLETNPMEDVPGERFVLFTPSYEDLAYILGMTAALLDQKGYTPHRLLWLGPGSEPLARTFAEWWDIAEENIRAYQPGDNTEDEDDLGLLVMAHSYDVFTLQDEQALFELIEAREGLILFTLDLHWTERQPIVPDIAGFMSQVCYLPWEAKVEQQGNEITATPIAPEDRPDPRDIAKEIAAQFPEEKECDEFAEETLALYAACTDLILDHRDGELTRKSLVTHSPIQSPRIGF
jgi:tetratricopeptide (TPR) repeat protein